jgi:hyaluronate lyase
VQKKGSVFKLMCRRCFFVGLLVSWLSLTSLQAEFAEASAVKNVVENGGFENTIETSRNKWTNNIEPVGWLEWYASGSPVAAVDQQVFYEGTKSVKLTATSDSRAALSSVVRVEAGKQYVLSAKIKTDHVISSNGVFIRTQYLDATGKKISDGPKSTKLTGTNGWTEREMVLTIPNNTVQVKVEPFFETGTGTAWFDDLKLQEWNGLSNLELSQQHVSVEKGGSLTLYPIFTPSTIESQTVLWSTSNATVATVEQGVVTGVNEGEATITASTLDGRFMVTSKVTVESAETMKQFDVVREKWFNKMTGGSDVDTSDATINTYITELTTRVTNEEVTGYWDTLDTSESRTYLWSDRASTTDPYHISYSYGRLKDMALAYSIEGSSLYQNEELKQDIIQALDWMYENRYNENQKLYGNWYVWEIAIPQVLNDLMVLMYSDLSDEQIHQYIRAIDHFVPDPEKRESLGNPDFRETGANLLDKAQAVTLRGIIGKSSEKVNQGKNSIGSEFVYVNRGDGVYRDGSLVQHFNIAYTGQYGVTWVRRAAEMTYLLNGSPWTVDDPNVDNVYDWVTNTFEPVIYQGQMMDMVNGRAIARPGASSAKGIIITILQLAEGASPEKAALLKSMVKGFVKSDPNTDYTQGLGIYEMHLLQAVLEDDSIPVKQELVKHQVFAGMDRVVHRRPGYAFGISMFSDRISAFEYGNLENSKGWFTGIGMTNLYNADSTQYTDHYWATIDMFRLPGTTTDRSGEGVTPQPWYAYMNTQNWVGGVSTDNQFGAAGMDFTLKNVTGSSLSGKKSWFSFDDEFIALGSDISSIDGKKVETIIDNRKIGNDGQNLLIINGDATPTNIGWSETKSNVAWAHLQGNVANSDIGYYFPETASVTGLREARTGSWFDINQKDGSKDPITRNYVSLALDHGVNPKQASYAYVVLPNKDAVATEHYSMQPDISILSHTSDVHAVRESKLGITAANFWQAGTVDFITAHNPSSVMVKEGEGTLSLSVSDPTQKLEHVRIELEKSGWMLEHADESVTVVQTTPTIVVDVNVSGSAGKSHNVIFRDAQAPTIEAPETVEVWQTEGGSIPMIVQDDQSGVKDVKVKIDGQEVGKPVKIAPLSFSVGKHIVEIEAVDQVGNVATRKVALHIKMDLQHLDDVVIIAKESGLIDHTGTVNQLVKRIEAIQKNGNQSHQLTSLEHSIERIPNQHLNETLKRLIIEDILYIKGNK